MTAGAPALPYPPPWQDISTLCAHICVSAPTVDAWMKQGILPPPRLRGGKRLWKWAEVEAWLDSGRDGVAMSGSPDAARITTNVRAIVAAKSA